MRKATFVALSTLLVASACKQSPEATQGVDTTLNDAEAAPPPSLENALAVENESSYTEPMDGITDTPAYAGEGTEEGAASPDTAIAATDDLSREATSASGPQSWVSTDNYPPSALRAGEQGTVAMTWDINAQGRVENCQVTTSSGSDALDRASCAAITRRGRYSPAMDSSGTPIRSTGSTRIGWRIPTD